MRWMAFYPEGSIPTQGRAFDFLRDSVAPCESGTAGQRPSVFQRKVGKRCQATVVRKARLERMRPHSSCYHPHLAFLRLGVIPYGLVYFPC